MGSRNCTITWIVHLCETGANCISTFPAVLQYFYMYWQVNWSETLNTNIFRELYFPVVRKLGNKSTKIKMTLQNSSDNGVERWLNGMLWNLFLNIKQSYFAVYSRVVLYKSNFVYVYLYIWLIICEQALAKWCWNASNTSLLFLWLKNKPTVVSDSVSRLCWPLNLQVVPWALFLMY